jgi:hypothetical protein
MLVSFSTILFLSLTLSLSIYLSIYISFSLSLSPSPLSERCTNEVMSVGINSVREILVRVPAILREPDMGDFIEGTAPHCVSVPCLTPPQSMQCSTSDLPLISLNAFIEGFPFLTYYVCSVLQGRRHSSTFKLINLFLSFH